MFSCPKCGASRCVLYRKSSTMVGLYCSDCGAWIKWVGKVELSRMRNVGVAFVSELPERRVVESQNLGFTRETAAQPVGSSTNSGASVAPTPVARSGPTPVPNMGFTESAPVVQTTTSQVVTRSPEVPSGGCPFCKGLDSVVLPQFSGFESEVEVYLLGDVLVVANKETKKVTGMVRFRYCPKCGGVLH